MPAKSPILKKKHILIIIIVGLFALLIGASPAIYQRVSERSLGSTNLDTIAQQEAILRINAPYAYVFPIANDLAAYYFPATWGDYDAFVQDGSPVYIPNFNHADAGCNWSGVAGQVFEIDHDPLNGYTIVITGRINGNNVSLSSVTGSSQAYGIGGYEIQLNNATFASSGALTAYLYDANLKQVAKPISLTTYQDCQANLLLLNYISR
jgi:hypothetical protein